LTGNKRTTAAALALLLALLCCACAGIEKDRANRSLEFMLDKETDTYTFFYYTDTSTVTELVIPDTFHGKPVTRIRGFAVNSCDTLEKIVIGKNVTDIERWAITKNLHLKEIKVDPDNPSYCDVDGVLFTKDKTKLLCYPNANTAVYNKDGSLKNTVKYTVPGGTTVIGHCAFYHCYAVEALVLPDSVIEIEERAFHKMTALTDIDVGKGLQTIGEDAFLGCESLREIDLPASLAEIGSYAFYNAREIVKINIAARSDEVAQGYKWQPASAGGNLNHPWSIVWADQTETF